MSDHTVGAFFLFVGLVLTAPYLLIAGDTNPTASWGVTMMMLQCMTTFMLSLMYAACLRNSEDAQNRARMKGIRRWIFLYCMPLLLNAASAIAFRFGWQPASEFLFALRYYSVIALLCFMIFYSYIIKSRVRSLAVL